jgi:hypothetical protein
VHGRAIRGENDRESKYIIGRESIPKIRGMTLRSLSGFGKG